MKMAHSAVAKSSFLRRILFQRVLSPCPYQNTFTSTYATAPEKKEGEGDEKKASDRKKPKSLIEVARFLPGWGVGAKFAKNHWSDDEYYKIIKIRVYLCGDTGAAWGIFHRSGNLSKLSRLTRRMHFVPFSFLGKRFCSISGIYNKFRTCSKKQHTSQINVSNNLTPEKLLAHVCPDGVITRIFSIIASEENLIQAFWEVKDDRFKSNLPITVPGDWFPSTRIALEEGRYAYKRISTDIPGTSVTRLLLPQDRIVQQAFKRILEPYYEGFPRSDWAKDLNLPPIFSERSHGFRPNRGIHTIMKELNTWNEISWILDYAVEKGDDYLYQKKLMKTVRQRVADCRVTDEINKMFSCNIIGTDQSCAGTLSSLLFNIHMTELDNFILGNLKNKFDIGRSSIEEWKEHIKINSTYGLKSIFRKHHGAPLADKNMFYALTEHYRKYCDQESSRHLRYVRYADSFLIGIGGSEQDARDIRKKVNDFLKSSLHISINKDDLVDLSMQNVEFLGFRITKPSMKETMPNE